PLVGAGAACILYFFLVSGLLAGSMFPKLGEEGTRPVPTAATPAVASERPATSPLASATGLTARDLALLVVWCFIAGFSEQLVPTLVTRTENRLGGQGMAPERFRPGAGDTAGAGDTPIAGGPAGDKKAPAPTASAPAATTPAGGAAKSTPS